MGKIYDRIDLLAYGAWVSLRPTGLALSFGANELGGKMFDSISDVELPFGTTIGKAIKTAGTFFNQVCLPGLLPTSLVGTTVPSVSNGSDGILFNSLIVDQFSFSSITVPANINLKAGLRYTASGLPVPSGVVSEETVFTGPISIIDYTVPYDMSYGIIVSGSYNAFTFNNITVSSSDTTCRSIGTVKSSTIIFPKGVELQNVLIPFGALFDVAITIAGTSFPVGVYVPQGTENFLMNTVQLIDINDKAITSVHDIETLEVIAFTRPTANMARLVMYRNGIGVDAEPFCCYMIVFKTTITAAQILAFNALHPADINPIIIDECSITGSVLVI